MNKTSTGGENRYEGGQPWDSNSQGEGETMPLANPKCPRCDSLDTKFCYFNNKKTSQPRYGCKICKRFWTEGGTVRNIRSEGEEKGMKRARAPSTQDGSATYFPSPAVPSPSPPPPPPFTMASAAGNFGRVRTLNLTRPSPAADHPQLKFVRVDMNRLSLAQGCNRLPYMVYPQAQGQSYSVPPNYQVYQATSNGQGFATQREPGNHLSCVCHNQAGSSHYMEPNNTNISRDNSNQICRTCGGLSGSYSSAWYP